jgi:F-type H+-transporting ATPase subunit b
MELFHEAEFWVAVAFFLLIALFVYLKVPAKIIAALDERAAGIAKTLAEAEKLRTEAQNLLKEYQKKRQEAEGEAELIIAQARKDAEAYVVEARSKLKELIERRSAAAEQKIEQAEAAALKEVRSATAELAVSVATRVLKEELKGPQGAKLVDRSIADLKDKLN